MCGPPPSDLVGIFRTGGRIHFIYPFSAGGIIIFLKKLCRTRTGFVPRARYNFQDALSDKPETFPDDFSPPRLDRIITVYD